MTDELSGAFVTVESFGNPDPDKREAFVKIAFRGDGASDRAHAARDYLDGLVKASALHPTPEGQTEGAVEQWGWRVRAKADAKRSAGPWSWQPDPLTSNTMEWAEQEPVYVAALASKGV